MGKKRISTPEGTAVIYARFSSHNQREESLDAQIRACSEFAARKGLNIVEIYTDAAKSGTSSDRESFLKMIEDSALHKFRYCIVHKLDRFSRDKYDAVTFKRKLKMNGVTILSVVENLDDSPESLMLESCLEGMAQYYSSNLSREVMKGMKESAYKATHLGGIPPLGYAVDPETKKYVVVESEAAIVKAIFEKYSGGIGYNKILDHLNGMGLKTKRGNFFGKNSLFSILKNVKYTGTYVFNRKLEKDVSGKRSPQIKPAEDWIVVEGGLPAIIDKEVFDKVQEKMAYNKKNSGSFKAKETYLLTGIIECGACGVSMYGNSRMCGRNKRKYSSYRCASRANHQGCTSKEIRREHIDNYVLEALYTQLFSDRSIKKLAAMLNDYNQKKSSELNSETVQAQNELEEVKAKISAAFRLVTEAGISIETVREDMKALEERKKFIEAYIEEMSTANKASKFSEDMLLTLIVRSKELVRSKNILECRNFIKSFIEKVILFEDKAEVQYKIRIPGEDGNSTVPLKSIEDLSTVKNLYKSAV